MIPWHGTVVRGAFKGFEPENNLTESHHLNNSVKDTQGSEYVILKEDCEGVPCKSRTKCDALIQKSGCGNVKRRQNQEV